MVYGSGAGGSRGAEEGAGAQRIGAQLVWSAMPIPLYPATKKRCCDRNVESSQTGRAVELADH
jgi:hypothetical protein